MHGILAAVSSSYVLILYRNMNESYSLTEMKEPRHTRDHAVLLPSRRPRSVSAHGHVVAFSWQPSSMNVWGSDCQVGFGRIRHKGQIHSLWNRLWWILGIVLQSYRGMWVPRQHNSSLAWLVLFSGRRRSILINAISWTLSSKIEYTGWHLTRGERVWQKR